MKTRFDELPVEIQAEMLRNQVAQGNEKNPDVFRQELDADKLQGGFNWRDSLQGMEVWQCVMEGNYQPFFDWEAGFNKVCEEIFGTSETEKTEKTPETTDKDDKQMLDLALAQFLGWNPGRRNPNLLEMVNAMGLTKKEWRKIKNSETPHYLTTEEVDEIDRYFNA